MKINHHMRSVHNIYIKLLCNELEAEGVALEEALAAAQLPTDFMSRGDGMVSIHEYHRLEIFAKKRTTKPWLGLDVGKKIMTQHHGPLGYLIASSSGLSAAIDFLLKFVVLRTQLLELTLQTDDTRDEVRLNIVETQNLDEIRGAFLESFLIIIVNVLQLVHGKAFQNLRIEFNYDAPEYIEKYEEIFDCPLAFSCKKTAVIFEKSALASNNIMADPKANRLAEIECQNLYDNFITNDGLKNRITAIILEAENGFPSMEVVAEKLNMSKSTFIRKLTKANTSFKTIMEGMRQELASYYLIETELPIESVADKLGYQDTSNFSRVFKRWYNTTPSAFRDLYNKRHSNS